MVSSSSSNISTLSILIIEDNPGDARLIKEMLSEDSSINFVLFEALELRMGFQILEENRDIDIILLDLNLSDSSGLKTLEKTLEKAEGIPIIVLTGNDDVEQGIKGLKQGAQDYLIKDELNPQVLTQSIYYAIERFKLILDRLDAEERIIHVNKVLYAIRQVNQLIVREKNKQKLIQEACQNIVLSRGYLGSYIILIRDENRILSYAEAGFDEKCEKFKEQIIKGNVPTCALKAIKNESIYIINKLEDVCTPSCFLLSQKEKFASLTYKLKHLDKIFGVITVFLPLKWANDEEELDLFEEMANDLGYALHFIELEEKKKNYEENLKKSEAKYQNLYETAPIPYLSLSPEGDIITANQAASQFLGYSLEELQEMKVLDLYATKSKLQAIDLFKTFRQGYSFKNEEMLYLTKDGREVPGLLSFSTFKDEQARVIESRSVIVDITDLKKVTQRLQESEKKFRSIFEAIPDLFFLVNKDFKILDFQAKNMDELFVSPDQFLHKKVVEILPYDISIQIQESILKTFKFNSVQILEYSLPFNEHSQYFEGRFLPFSEDKVAVFIREITDRKQAEKQLLESEEQFRSISEQALVGIVIIQDDAVKYVNKKFIDILKYSVEEILEWDDGKFFEIFHPDDRPTVKKFSRMRQNGDPNALDQFHCRMNPKTGNKIWIEAYATTMNYKGRSADFITILDITDRRNAEIHLSESEEKFRSIAEQTSLGIAILQNDQIIYANQGLSDIVEYSIKDRSSWTSREFIQLIHEDDRMSLMNFLLDFYSEKITENFGKIYRLYTKNNKLKWVEIHAKTIQYEGKTAILVSIVDITALKEAEKKLKESEEKFRSIAEQTIVGISIIQDEAFKFVNETLANIFGYEIEEMLSWTLKDFFKTISPDDIKIAIKESINDSERIQLSFSNEPFRIIRKDGTIRWINSYTKYIQIESKNALLIIAMDITEKKLAEERIREAEEKERMESIIETIPDAILVLSSDWSLVLANRAFKELFYKIEKVEMPPNFNLFDHANIDFFLEISERFICKNLEPCTLEPIKGLYLQVNIAELSIPGKKEYGAIFIFRDVSTFVEFENLRKKFVSTISHEIRTPISVIIQSINNYAKYGEQMTIDLREKIIQTMSLNADLLSTMVEDLLTISRIEEKKYNLEWKEYNIHEVCAQVLSQLEPKRSEKKVFITYDIDENLNLYGDNQKIAQIFRIIIDNAIKYIPRECTLHVKALDHYIGKYNASKKDGILIKFIDDGNGIPEDELPYIFERFFRSRKVADIPGTGLGLPIAKELVQLHDGEIFVDSKLKEGTTFSIFLPKLKASPQKKEKKKINE